MRSRFRRFILLAVIFIGITAYPVQGKPVLTSAAVPSAAAFTAWTDEFDQPTLNPRWSWVREDAALWSLTAQPGSLVLTANGTLFSDYNNAKNILLTSAPDGDFRLVTHLLLDPKENYQGGTLIVYQDDDHYLELTRDFSTVQSVEFNKTWGTDWSGRWNGSSATEIYLRIDRRGSEYQGFYSTDGATWIGLGAHTIAFTNPKIGVYAPTGPGPSIPVQVHSISLSPLQSFHTGPSDAFNGALSSGWSWVREDPSHWNLTDVPGKLRIISQAGSLYIDYNSTKNILLRDTPAGDFSLTTKVDFAPSEFLQSAGLVVYQDDDNYIHLSRAYDSKQEIEFRIDTTSQPFSQATLDYTPTTTYLRIDRDGSRYFAYYSDDGVNWRSAGSATLNFNHPKIGLAISGGPSTLATPADFDYFNLQDNDPLQVYLPVIVKSPPPVTGKVVFASDRTGNFEIYKMLGDGSGVKQLTSGFNGTNDDPSWSPDSK